MDPLRGDPHGAPDRGPWVPRDLPPVTPEDSGESWSDDWLTPDEARALRAAEAMRVR